MDRRLRWAGITLLAPCLGCSIAPKGFHDVVNAAPLTRARAAGMGEGLPNSAAVPALLDRLGDSDPVVRLSAHEALKRRTGKDFGYVPWGDLNDRAAAAARWRAWWNSRQVAQTRVRTAR